MAPGAWLPDVTVNKNGDTYVAITTWEVNGLNSGSNAIIVGTTETQFEMDSWEWTDYEDNYFGVGISHVASNNFSVALNHYGLAVVATTQDQDDGEFYLSYSFSEDWGENWNLTPDSKLHRVLWNDLFADVWGTSVNSGTGVVSDIGLTYDFDLIVTDYNKIHFACYAQLGDGNFIFPYNDDGAPLTGWYDIVGEINAAGDDITWTPHFISHKIGWEDEQSSNPGQIHIGSSEYPSIIFVTMMDKPLTGAIASEWPDGNFNYIIDGFTTLSFDGGDSWLTEEYIGADDTYYHAYNVTNTPNDLEEGWAGSVHSIYDWNEDVTYFFAANQYYDPENPVMNVEDYSDHEQFLHIWR